MQIKILIIIIAINLLTISCSKSESDKIQDESRQLETYDYCDTALFTDLGFHFYRHKLGSNFRNFKEYYVDENDFERAKKVCYTAVDENIHLLEPNVVHPIHDYKNYRTQCIGGVNSEGDTVVWMNNFHALDGCPFFGWRVFVVDMYNREFGIEGFFCLNVNISKGTYSNFKTGPGQANIEEFHSNNTLNIKDSNLLECLSEDVLEKEKLILKVLKRNNLLKNSKSSFASLFSKLGSEDKIPNVELIDGEWPPL